MWSTLFWNVVYEREINVKRVAYRHQTFNILYSYARPKANAFVIYVSLHCKDKIPKFRNKYSQKRNIGALVPISPFMRLWAIYIFPRSVSLFCWRKYVYRSWDYINRSQTHECWNWGWGRAIPRKGIYKWDSPCSVGSFDLRLSFVRRLPSIDAVSFSSIYLNTESWKLLCQRIAFSHSMNINRDTQKMGQREELRSDPLVQYLNN